ncbi:MAG: hypothetical protein B5M55_01440 [Desulfococcus sp. 4484_242]|nr:MAG: hypothetical protein B5M55_01440 [Desulfococcus sp. 4484_242]
MKIKAKHKPLLKKMGLSEDDFARFDGKHVSYEFDLERGVRIYDPFYTTSYDEYIGIDGWSAWSSENDTFMSHILKGSGEKREGTKAPRPKADIQQMSSYLQKKFGKSSETDVQ